MLDDIDKRLIKPFLSMKNDIISFVKYARDEDQVICSDEVFFINENS